MFRKLAQFLLLQCAVGVAAAAPVAYSFSTGANPFGGPAISGLPDGFSTMFSSATTVSGSFTFDSESPLNPTGIAVGGLVYGTHSLSSPTAASFSNLSGSVAGLNFSDPRGTTISGNERTIAGFSTPVDYFGLWADPSPTSTAQRSISGFSIGGYTLVNVRLFWIETQTTPTLIPDFQTDESLPSAPPSFAGRLAFDFVETGSTSTDIAGYVFFDGLTVSPVIAVPEPSTYGLMLGGVGLVIAVARRRKVTNG